MFTSTPLSLLSFIMESVQQLDPTLLAFWEGFPCPPPWKEELLFRLNWTGCIGQEVGEKVKLYMADKCNIRHDGNKVLPEPGEETDDGVMVEEECGLTCQLIIGVVCVLFLVLLLIIVVFCVRRHRAKPASPSHQSSLTAHPDNAKYYTSCHYACAPVVARQLQTTLNGDRTETTVLPAGSSSGNGIYQPGTYPQHNCQQIAYHYPHRHLLSQQPRIINTPYGQVPAHTSSLVVPQHSRYNPNQHYRKLDGAYSSSSISNSDRSPVYESIGDSDSIRDRARGREASVSECEFCECGDHGSDQGGCYAGYHDPVILGDPKGHGNVYLDKLGQPMVRGHHDSGGVFSHQKNEDPPAPCPPMFMDSYYGDKCPQTLPLRPLRGHSRREEGSTSEYPDIQPDELSPLKRKDSSNQTGRDGEMKLDGSIRRRPSSGSSHNSGNNSVSRDGQRGVIPALHPHYFVASADEIS